VTTAAAENEIMHRQQPFISRSLLRVCALLVACTFGVPATAGTDELDSFVATEMRRWALPGVAIAVVKDGEMVFARGYGVRQIDRPDRVDENTTFGIGSVTKSFTAASTAMLVDEGKLAWDAAVIDYVPSLHFFDPWITAHASVRDLASHRLGIEDAAIYMLRGGDLDWTAHAVRYMRPELPFRTFLYSNTGYAMLGKTIASTSNLSWDDFIAQRIFKPLGMSNSYPSEHSFIDANKLANCWLCESPAGTPLGRDALRNRNANTAVPHGLIDGADTQANTAARVKILPWRAERSVASTGLIHSSARDMAQWMLLHLGQGEYKGRRLISTEQMKQLHSAQALVLEADSGPVEGFRLEGYGMGWFVGLYRGMQASQHGGGRVGFGSQVWLFPEKQLGIVVLQNLDYREGPPLSRIAMRFADHYLGLPHVDDKRSEERATHPRVVGARSPMCSAAPADASTKDLGRYAGTYRNDMLGDAQIRYERDHLVLTIEQGIVADLRSHASADFVICARGHEQPAAPLKFTFDAADAPNGFLIGATDLKTPSNLGYVRVK
jgi:CubicO group peptidase (beta-lactamase class C family)